ncbi:hypothetical protein [Umezawaea sp. Da 62-37]|uniref:hypothetical protein n=1 Tax=Umezawaea sp. Da 62-37 TaxID=3075927 RepID=UPI0028F6CD1B|nr:hypothetical protein [Umezawaea sp. Da 62-37]WNV86825.1 hypothetical protein RM788_00620 [Umezawaea sp. Da 62-37]
MTDEDLAVALLRATPTHENRTEEQLRSWAATALEFADELPVEPADVHVVEKSDGVTGGLVTLAEYDARTRTVTVHTDSLALLADVAARKGWTDVTPEALREAAVAHEVAHHRLHGGLARALRRRLDHVVCRVGSLKVRGHVVGADEVVAHRYAHRASGLRRSPLQLSAALAELGG